MAHIKLNFFLFTVKVARESLLQRGFYQHSLIMMSAEELM
jgi:hypothetical protein